MINKEHKFGIYTSFYNAEKFIDDIFKQFEAINYQNWKWIVTDDFSSDNTKDILIKKCKQYGFVEYVEQQHKKEMYWQPNKFFDDSFDYVVLIDCDDEFDVEFLNVYNHFANQYPEASLLSSDCMIVNEKDNSLHSISLVKHNKDLVKCLESFHPEVDYINNESYNVLGHLRCFKNFSDLEFEIDDFDACAEDSYRVMWMNSLGEWLHIPRPLYNWYVRSDSESRSEVKNNFNGNFDIAYRKLKSCAVEPIYHFNDVYKETCSIAYVGINKIRGRKLCLLATNLNSDQKKKLKNLYFDSEIVFGLEEDVNNDCDFYFIICNNYFKTEDLVSIKDTIRKNYSDKKIIFYYYEDRYHKTMQSLQEAVRDSTQFIIDAVKDYSYFFYFRHNYISI